MNRNFIHFNLKETFTQHLNSGMIPNDSIVFINDTGEIYTHGGFYPNFEFATEEDINTLFTYETDNA